MNTTLALTMTTTEAVTLATALATLALAVYTARMAGATRKMAETSEEQAEIAQKALGLQQADIDMKGTPKVDLNLETGSPDIKYSPGGNLSIRVVNTGPVRTAPTKATIEGPGMGGHHLVPEAGPSSDPGGVTVLVGPVPDGFLTVGAEYQLVIEYSTPGKPIHTTIETLSVGESGGWTRSGATRYNHH